MRTGACTEAHSRAKSAYFHMKRNVFVMKKFI